MEPGTLRLLAEDAADLDVISAAAQDALIKVSDMAFDKKAHRFSLFIRRFRWEKADAVPPYERINAALPFDSVLGVKSKHVRRDAPRALASILSIRFEEGEAPGGTVRILLAGGGEVSLEVECIDAALIDLGEAWRTPRRPDHETP
jgi:hypothetical protein